MATLQAYLDQANAWISHVQQIVVAYFQGCSQNELYAWGAESVGLLLMVAGVVVLII